MEMVSLVIAMLLTGIAGGVLAGLLGVGGGLVIVPMLEAALAFVGVEASVRMHIAVATSLATIIPTSISSARAHYRRQSIDFGLIRYWSPYIIVGAIAGTIIAANVEGSALAAVFAAVAFGAAIKMMLPLDEKSLAADVPRGLIGPVIPAGIGAVSTLMGIGGGTLSVPAMTLSSKTIHMAVGTSALFGLVIALPSTLGYVVAGWGHAELPFGSLGYVNLLGFALIAPATVLFAPLGAKIAHALSRRVLSLLFGFFLFAIALRMTFRALAW
ncbi:MAG: sulfite exporter TauE/SafE family protein [Gammaproteobacteria bacterium]|nr:sulfite exporter TauE/SafE family protein [Gammaproteobacteria bacterium]MDH3430348.1 sulfite exporter TauE/SafE family protein [Gammaproteobacteria bacterium]